MLSLSSASLPLRLQPVHCRLHTLRMTVLIIPLLLTISFYFTGAQPSAWYQQVDYQRGDVVPWGADILGEFYETIRVVSGVSLQERVLFSWRLPRDLARGCSSAGFDLEVTNTS